MIRALGAMVSGPFARAMLTAFFFFGSLNGFVLLPLYIHQLGGTEASIGMVQGLYSATGIVCQPLVGAWIDRLGRRTFMLLGTSVLTVATAAFIVTSSIPGLAVLRALHGVAFSAFFVANYLYVVDLVPPERRGWALGIFGLSGLISTSLAPLFGEFLVRHWGFRVLFAFSTLLAVAATAVAERMRDVRPPALGVGTTVDVFRDSVREVWRLHMGLMFCFGLGTGTIFTFLPTFAEALGVRGLGLFYTAYAVAAMLVRLVGGQLIDLRGPRAVIIPSMFVQVGAALDPRPRGGLHLADGPRARPAVSLPRRLPRGRRARVPLSRAVGAARGRDAGESPRAGRGNVQLRVPPRQCLRSHGVRVRRPRARVSRDVEQPHGAAAGGLPVEPPAARRRSEDGSARRVI